MQGEGEKRNGEKRIRVMSEVMTRIPEEVTKRASCAGRLHGAGTRGHFVGAAAHFAFRLQPFLFGGQGHANFMRRDQAPAVVAAAMVRIIPKAAMASGMLTSAKGASQVP